MVITLDFESSNPGSNPGRTFFADFCPIAYYDGSKFKTAITKHNPVQWPSGLRRSTQVRVSSEAWVRIPLEPPFFSCKNIFVVAKCFSQKRKKMEVLPGLEPGSVDSESTVITITL